MLDLFDEDYSTYMSDCSIYHIVHSLLRESDITHKSFLEIKKLFDNAVALRQDNVQVLSQIKELCLSIIGRDIFKKEIHIVDGHNSSSYFWIMPVRVIDYSDTSNSDSIAEMRSVEISIEEDDVGKYLMPFLNKHFDDELEANKKRQVSGFEWYLTHNFYTFNSMDNILTDIKDTIDCLSSGRENELTTKLREKRGTAAYELLYARELTEEQIEEHNANRAKEDNTEIELIIDFYH